MEINPFISICLPSKGRPLRLQQMIQSAVDTASNPQSLEFCVYVDSNDPPIIGWPEGPIYKVVAGPRMATSTMINSAFSQSTGEILMYAADDILFRTQNWDNMVRKCLKNPLDIPALLMPNDLSPSFPKIATHGFVTRKLTQNLNYLLPTYFESEFCDTWLSQICRKAKILYVREELVIEHLHPLWGKSEVDDTYLFRSNRYRHWEQKMYYSMMFLIRKREINQIRIQK